MAVDIKRLASTLQPDAVQLFYTVAVHSRSELAIAPDEYAGFVMACLRMLSLSGAAGGAQQQVVPQVAQATAAPVAQPSTAQPSTAQPSTAQPSTAQPSTAQPSTAQPSTAQSSLQQASAPPATAQPVQAAHGAQSVVLPPSQQLAEADADSEPPDLDLEPEYFSGNDLDYGSEPVFDQADDGQFTDSAPVAPVSDTIVLPESWAGFSAKLPLSGMAAQLARQSEWVGVSGRAITLRVASKALSVGAHADRLRAVLTEYFGFVVQVYFEIGAGQGRSAHAVDLAAQVALQQAAERSVTTDPFVQALMQDFGAQVVPGSIRPGHASL